MTVVFDVFWYPFKLIPEPIWHFDGPDGICGIKWLGCQLLVFTGVGSQMAIERLQPKAHSEQDSSPTGERT